RNQIADWEVTMRILLRYTLSLLLLTCLVVPAVACLNDREVNTAEREFKSQYLDKTAQPVSPGELSVPSPDEGHAQAAAVLGIGLLAGATVLGLTRPNKRS